MRHAMLIILAFSLGCDDERDTCKAVLAFPGVRVTLPIDVTDPATFDATYDLRVVADGVELDLVGLRDFVGACPECAVEVPRDDGVVLRSALVIDTLHVSARAPCRIPGGPRELSVTLWRDGVEIASGDFRPDYRLELPDGCTLMARAAVTLKP